MTSTATATTLHLQGIGRCPAILASDVKVGDITSWNYSPQAYEVTSVERASAKFLAIVERDRKTGKSYTRRIKLDRLIVVSR